MLAVAWQNSTQRNGRAVLATDPSDTEMPASSRVELGDRRSSEVRCCGFGTRRTRSAADVSGIVIEFVSSAWFRVAEGAKKEDDVEHWKQGVLGIVQVPC